ncbi:DUF4176 domain-containing protein [Streptococcus pluranimalium]|uniref:DUF4176 domain-containing protein n=1 Tax=Streptococcus pluranimalium TaxID=82348 RepID=UPI0034655ECF
MTKLLPLGSVVYLEEGTQKIMIIGRGVIFKDEESNQDVYTDYLGCLYPTGMNPENTLFFNDENIDKVVFKGLEDDDEERFMEIYQDWEKELTVSKRMID